MDCKGSYPGLLAVDTRKANKTAKFLSHYFHPDFLSQLKERVPELPTGRLAHMSCPHLISCAASRSLFCCMFTFLFIASSFSPRLPLSSLSDVEQGRTCSGLPFAWSPVNLSSLTWVFSRSPSYAWGLRRCAKVYRRPRKSLVKSLRFSQLGDVTSSSSLTSIKLLFT